MITFFDAAKITSIAHKTGSSIVFFLFVQQFAGGGLEVPSFCINTLQQTAVYIVQASDFLKLALRTIHYIYAWYALFMLG